MDKIRRGLNGQAGHNLRKVWTGLQRRVGGGVMGGRGSNAIKQKTLRLEIE